MRKVVLPEEKIKKSQTILYRIIKMLSICLIIFCILLLTFYIIGNYQNFQDSSQKIILSVLLYFSILNVLISIPIIIENIFMIFTGQNIKAGIISLFFTILSIIFGVICIVIAFIISFLSAGL